ncbi:MAG: hypothetical protein KJZ47_06555, partial [Gemmatimonadales bacterium]|nr:hypothetical protein [Gemmatimonadales bacterium]
MSVAAGNQQSALVGAAVAVAPAVRVVNSVGAAVPGVAVTFTVGLGGGSVTSASPSTGTDGVAAVGSWVLGAAGVNTLVASVAGATEGSPITFSATGQEAIIAPAADTTINGTIQTTQFTVPAGVTVTLGSDVLIRSTVRVTVNGTIRGDCRRFEVDASGEVVLTGTIDNSCLDPAADGPVLRIVARGGYALTGGSLRSGGDVEVTNDPTLTDQDFGAAPAFTSMPHDPQAILVPPCTFGALQYVAVPARAPDGASGGANGGTGRNGRTFTGRCRGSMNISGGMSFTGQHGGHGGDGLHQSSSQANASGGSGGDGGRLRLQATADIGFTGANTVRSGDGGDGGSAAATATAPGGTSSAAAGATALARAGGAPGLLTIRANGQLSFGPGTTLQVGNGGNGGDALATGADGAPAGAGPAQGGGAANATSGRGGDSPNHQVSAGGNVVGTASIFLTGGHGGFGGKAIAVGGAGGAGSEVHPAGGTGGATTAVGGRGGNVGLLNFQGIPIGNGGRGGDAELTGASGGAAGTQCVATPGLMPGVVGGVGGGLTATHGPGGTGAATGADGATRFVNARGGGRGGNGWPNGGAGGAAGTQTLSKPAVIVGPIPFQGQPGFKCLGVLGGFTSTGYLPPAPGLPPCRTQTSSVEFVSFVNAVVTFSIAFDPAGSNAAQNYTFGALNFNPNASGPTFSGPTPAYVEAIHQMAGARGIAYTCWENCSTSIPFPNSFTIAAT